MKTVMFQGNMYSVPAWAKWIARDGDGEVWAYTDKPHLRGSDMEFWTISGLYASCEQVYIVQPEQAFSVECMPIPSENV